MLGNRALLELANALFGSSCSELCYGYAAFRRTAILGLGLTAVGFEIETQLFLRAIRHGLRVDEVPSFEAPRRSGTSNLHTFRDGWRVLRTILSERLRHGRPRSALEERPESFFVDSHAWVAVPVESGHIVVSAHAELSGD